ncbi:B12-binding domain-containing protein [Fictibacillus iocasae]|uniref:B12-binding domain-containing protein n=1 Tax=Fictibacillus iocasae TaxID=2715437 RepID=A0ABW2NT77_9BACL
MDQTAKRLAHYFLEGNFDDALHTVREHQANYASLEVFSSLLTPAMKYIGELWENSEITVADEHLATAVCDMVISHLYQQLSTSQNERQKAMFFCLEGEEHYLGLKMVNRLFEEDGWDTKYFGSNLPLEYAVKTAAEWKPQVIGLSVSIAYHLPKLKAYVKELESLSCKPRVIVGGRMAEKYDLRPYCSENTVIIHNIQAIADWLRQYQLGDKANAIS